MFEQHLHFVKEAQQANQEICQKYDKAKQELAIETKKLSEQENKKITDTLLGDYCPVSYHNSLTLIVDKYKNLEKEKEVELDQNTKTLSINLSGLIKTSGLNEISRVKENERIIKELRDEVAELKGKIKQTHMYRNYTEECEEEERIQLEQNIADEKLKNVFRKKIHEDNLKILSEL